MDKKIYEVIEATKSEMWFKDFFKIQKCHTIIIFKLPTNFKTTAEHSRPSNHTQISVHPDKVISGHTAGLDSRGSQRTMLKLF